MFKVAIVLSVAMAAIVSAQYYGGAGAESSGLGSYGSGDEHKDYYAYPKYKYEYGVKDGHTGDHKSQWEERDGDVVKGGYTLHEADGTERVVEYTSDKHNGFQAVVKRVGHADHPQVYGHQGQQQQGCSHLAFQSSGSKTVPATMFKFVLVLALAVAVSAQWEGGFEGGYGGEHKDYPHSHPKYKFEYGVKDHKTGDHKSQWESRDGDVVKGAYTLHEADGTERIVEYSSDKHNGFQAHVKRVGHAHHEGGHYGGESSSFGGFGNGGYGHGHGHASSYANNNLYSHHH
ncbi:pro-resilin [Culex quinquefasciatus]|uniref:pro-resilin n=1 Tax=Culex quinquefasciatus TaxID=7176 RepID=UPI0018E2EE91|nr:pro-resilin [Culex quinquefasciatus]